MLRLLQPGVAQWWGEWSFHYPKEFQDHISSLIREGEASE
jgi:hypothetical protein